MTVLTLRHDCIHASLNLLSRVVTTDCKTVELMSGDHWIPDGAITVSSSRDKDSGSENSRIDWTATGSHWKKRTRSCLNLPSTSLYKINIVPLN